MPGMDPADGRNDTRYGPSYDGRYDARYGSSYDGRHDARHGPAMMGGMMQVWIPQ